MALARNTYTHTYTTCTHQNLHARGALYTEPRVRSGHKSDLEIGAPVTPFRYRFNVALTTWAADGFRPRCGDAETHDIFVSDQHEHQQLAARWCAACPLRAPCTAADDMTA